MSNEGPHDARPPGLLASVRAFWRVLISNLHTRIELLTVELEEEALRLACTVGAGIAGVMALHGALFFALLWILAAVWDTAYRLWVIGGIFALYLGAAIGLLLYARHLIVNRPKFLSQTLTELKRDAEGLQTALKTEQP